MKYTISVVLLIAILISWTNIYKQCDNHDNTIDHLQEIDGLYVSKISKNKNNL